MSCGFGPCERSLERGGKGCDLCDRVAKLPQPRDHPTRRGELMEERKQPKRKKGAK